MNGDCEHERFDEATGRCADCGRRPSWAVKIEPIPAAMIVIGVALIIIGYIMMLRVT